MFETKEKVEQLNIFMDRRAKLLALLRSKEDFSNVTENDDENYVTDFENILNECKVCNGKIKELKRELTPKEYLKIEDDEKSYDGENSNETALVVKKENKLFAWLKNKINEYKYNYAVERALRRDSFIESNVLKQIESYTAYLNVLKSPGNKAIFKKYLEDSNEVKFSKDVITEKLEKMKQLTESELNAND